MDTIIFEIPNKPVRQKHNEQTYDLFIRREKWVTANLCAISYGLSDGRNKDNLIKYINNIIDKIKGLSNEK